MEKKYSSKWKSSKNPRKQRKYAANAPKHIKSKMAAAHLSKELRSKYGKRSATLRKGDKVKVVRGQFKGKSGKVESVNISKSKAFITGIEFAKKDGSKSMYPIHASNLIIEEMAMEDKKRAKRTGGKSN